MKKIIYVITALLVVVGLSRCAIKTIEEKPKEQKTIGLSWDNKEERKEWSKSLLKIIEKDLEHYEKAKDLEVVCPKFKSLNKDQKIRALAEFWIGLFFYESSWNPKSQGVDVGTKEDKDSWSIGLSQISVQDQWNMSVDFKYSFDDLLKPEPNMILANAIMKRQISLTGLLILPNSNKHRYWAIILRGNRDEQVDNVIKKVKQNSECL